MGVSGAGSYTDGGAFTTDFDEFASDVSGALGADADGRETTDDPKIASEFANLNARLAAERSALGSGGGASAAMLASDQKFVDLEEAAYENRLKAKPVPPSAQSGGGSTETFYTHASGSSWGDPHETENATTADGRTIDRKWDSMVSHADLAESDSVFGGYRASTETSTPDGRGVTYNKEADVRLGGLQAQLLADGTTQLNYGGRNYAIAQGQTIDFGLGVTAKRTANGLSIDESSPFGSSIDTDLTLNGRGVDVAIDATNENLGGYLFGGEA